MNNVYQPVTIFLFTKDNLYISLLNWKSNLDSVDPLQWNCTAIVCGTLGPSKRSKRALREPEPSKKRVEFIGGIIAIHWIWNDFWKMTDE